MNKIFQTGTRVRFNDEERPDQQFTGTVTKVDKILIWVLPDKEYQIMDTYYGLVSCFPVNLIVLSQPKKDNDRVLQNYKFKIQSFNDPYSKDFLTKFYEDILTVLDVYGFSIEIPKETAAAPEAIRGKTRIYCHYEEIAGECHPNDIDTIGEILSQCKTFRIVKSYKAPKTLFDYTKEEELAEYHRLFDDKIEKIILDAFRSEDGTYLKDYIVISEIAEKIKIKTIYNFFIISADNADCIYVREFFDKLVKEGKIVEGGRLPNDHYIRRYKTIV